MPHGASPTDPVAALWPHVELSPTEHALLRFLLKRPGEAVSRGELLAEVWGYRPDTRTRTVETTVQRIRSKIEADPARPQVLLTLRGRGYQLVPPRQHTPRPPARVHDEGSAFVGRQDELERLATLFRAGARLVTLVGPPGVGKTRLARRFAASGSATHADGALFCDLADCVSASDLRTRLTRTLGLFHTPTADRIAPIAKALRGFGQVLLVLDNLEQAHADAALEIERLVLEAPRLRVLVTSRERLGVGAEQRFPLEPLPRAEAERLLRVRLDAVHPEAGQDAEAGVVEEIAALLDGLPLALEMAAAQARLLPLDALLARLRRDFGVLSLDRRGAPERHETMREAIAWSWRTLSEPERLAAIQLCAFRGGGPLPVVEEVLDVPGGALPTLTALVDRSLARVEASGRIRLYESVRAYAEERAGVALEHARQRHARWAVRYATSWSGKRDTHCDTVGALARELDNLLAAHRWLLSQRDPAAFDVISSLRLLFVSEGRPEDLPERLRVTREQLEPTPAQDALLHLALAWTYRTGRDHARASQDVARGLACADPEDQVYAELLACRTWIELEHGRFEDAHATVRDAIGLAERRGWGAMLARLISAEAVVLHRLQRAPAAIAAFRRAIALSQEHGNLRTTVFAWNNLGAVLMGAGEMPRALDCIRRAEALASPLQDPGMQHAITMNQANATARLGQLAEADALYQTLLQADARYGGQVVAGAARVNAAIVALLVGDVGRACQVLEQADRLDGPTALVRDAYLLACYALLDDHEAAEQIAARLARAPEEPLTPSERAQVDLALGHLELLRARRLRAAGHPEDADVHLASARARLDEADSDVAIDTSLAADLLRKALTACTGL